MNQKTSTTKNAPDTASISASRIEWCEPLVGDLYRFPHVDVARQRCAEQRERVTRVSAGPVPTRISVRRSTALQFGCARKAEIT
jgi:hypothetical protein